MPPAHKSRASKEEQAEYDPSTLMVPHSAALPTPTPTTSQRHQSLPTLITSRPAPKVPSTASNGSSAPTPPPPAQASYNLSQALSLTPDSSPSLPSSPFSSSPNYYSPFPQPPPPPAGVLTSMMTRSHSSTPSFSHLPSPTSSHRPGSSGTFSSTSSRPWVRDSDASSVCSGGSGSCWSEKTGAGAESEEGDGSGEVLKVAGEGVECEFPAFYFVASRQLTFPSHSIRSPRPPSRTQRRLHLHQPHLPLAHRSARHSPRVFPRQHHRRHTSRAQSAHRRRFLRRRRRAFRKAR